MRMPLFSVTSCSVWNMLIFSYVCNALSSSLLSFLPVSLTPDSDAEKALFGLRKSLFRLMKQTFRHIRIAFPVSRNKP